MEIMFPVGDSYNFDIHLFYCNGDGEVDLTVTVSSFKLRRYRCDGFGGEKNILATELQGGKET